MALAVSIEFIVAYLLFHEALNEDQLLEGPKPLIPVASHLLLGLCGLLERRQLWYITFPLLWINRCLKTS